MRFIATALLISFSLFSIGAHAKIKSYRWTNQVALTDDIQSILPKLNSESGLSLTANDFKVFEQRDLANYRFTTLFQTARGIRINGALIRTWANLNTGTLVQMEASIEDEQTSAIRKDKVFSQKSFPKTSTFDDMTFAKKVVLSDPEDNQIKSIKSFDQWDGFDLQRVIEVKGRRGTHTIVVSHFSEKMISHTYEEFPRADIQALVYPIYEETEKLIPQKRIPVTLKRLHNIRRQIIGDPYAALHAQHFLNEKFNDSMAQTPEGRALGYWSYGSIKESIDQIYTGLPLEPNTFENGGVFLEGDFVTVNLFPDVASWKNLNFQLRASGQLKYENRKTVVEGRTIGEMVPLNAYYGRPLENEQSALNRRARRLPVHDPEAYLNDGFDEIQVYYAVDRLMESLHNMGFSDPELSTRPFHAFLYDPDITSKDNAYYTDDTINFTTYSDDSQNFARDNSTIWHELGHGIMDRLMGDLIRLADTGGLSEGMADFVAQLVIEDVTNGDAFEGSNDFRIINQTGFNLTNEVHDDGESYGGAMRDILVAAINKFGRPGLHKMTDLTLDTMRLTRNHPALTANQWFEHMLFADQLGHINVRQPNEMHDLIVGALTSRNFQFDNGEVASFKIVVNESTELTGRSPGSRQSPYGLTLNGSNTSAYKLTLNLKSSSGYKFRYPVKIVAAFNDGPLQGAVKWVNESRGPQVFTLANESQMVELPLAVQAGCDFVNRPDGSCSDYTYIQVYNAGESDPVAKKRFYVRVKSATKRPFGDSGL